jgi:hypothetical protein
MARDHAEKRRALGGGPDSSCAGPGSAPDRGGAALTNLIIGEQISFPSRGVGQRAVTSNGITTVSTGGQLLLGLFRLMSRPARRPRSTLAELSSRSTNRGFQTTGDCRVVRSTSARNSRPDRRSSASPSGLNELGTLRCAGRSLDIKSKGRPFTAGVGAAALQSRCPATQAVPSGGVECRSSLPFPTLGLDVLKRCRLNTVPEPIITEEVPTSTFPASPPNKYRRSRGDIRNTTTRDLTPTVDVVPWPRSASRCGYLPMAVLKVWVSASCW